MNSIVLAALVALGAPSLAQNPPELTKVLQRATEYVTKYEAELGNLIGTEEYVQNAVWLAPGGRGNATVAKGMQRRLSSDFLIIQVARNGQHFEK